MTTNVTDSDTAAFEITDIIDYVSSVSQAVLEKMYKGSKLINETPIQVAATWQLLMGQMSKQPMQVLNDSKVLSSVKDPNVTTQINVTGTINPVRTTKYILLSFSITV